MSRSMVIDAVFVGVIGYADRIAVDDNDPLSLLIQEEETEEECNPYPHSSTHCWAITRSAEEL